MIVVSDASPIIALFRIGELRILRDLFHEVVLPEDVRDELLTGDDGTTIFEQATWLDVKPVTNHARLAVLARELDLGEAAAIALAIELHAELLLIDERRGRQVATREGLSVTGVLGVLVTAKQRGILPAIQPVIHRLMSKANMHVAEDVVRRALRAAGEID